MNETAEYLTLLAISVALTFAVGRLLVVSGEPFLQEVFQDQKVSHSVNRLLSVLFYLVTLGVLAIISAIEFDLDGIVQTMVVKLGVVLLILGIAYGVSMLVLIRIRERRRATQISEQVQQKLSEQGVATKPVSQPVSEPDGPQPATPTQR
ncbi:MAG: hypothetical protein ACRDRK_06905 [Pseudonocardia sp.]